MKKVEDLERLIAIEEIKTLKARYWRGVDTKDFDMLRGVFAEHAEIDFRSDGFDSGAGPGVLPDAETFARHTLAILEGVVTMHHGHAPDIAFLSDEEATGFWPMEDHLWVEAGRSKLPFKELNGYGHYHDRYVKTVQGWRISATTLKRVHVETI
jgi:hypothetical protein